MRLHNGDCIEIMKKLQPESFDLIATDPPYNVSVEGAKIARGAGTAFEGVDISLDFGEWDRNKIDWKDYIDLFVSLLKSKGVLVMFYDKLYLGSIGIYLQEKYDFQVRHIGAIVKRNPAPQARRVKWQNGLEQFLIATKNKGEGHHFNYRLGQSPDYFETSVNYEHLHPTQKPLEAMSWLIQYWSFEGDTVFDPFMGSGTTGVACLEHNRDFTGIEISPEYFAIAEKRIGRAALQQNYLRLLTLLAADRGKVPAKLICSPLITIPLSVMALVPPPAANASRYADSSPGKDCYAKDNCRNFSRGIHRVECRKYREST